MSSSRAPQQQGGGAGSLLILAAVACALGWPGMFLAVLLQIVQRRLVPVAWRLVTWLVLGVAAVAGGMAYGFLARSWVVFPFLLNDLTLRHWFLAFIELSQLWLGSLWLGPALLFGLVFVAQPGAEQQVLKQAGAEEARYQGASQQALKRVRAMKRVPDMVQNDVVLGAAVAGDLPSWVKLGWLILPESELRKSTVIIGESRAGKSRSLLRLAYLVAKRYGWQVIFIDAKGDESLATEFVAAMLSAGLAPEQIRAFPFAAYDGWRGDAKAVFNRLVGLIKAPTMSSAGAEYYRDVLKLVLDLAIKARPEPPRSSGQLLNRMRHSMLELLYTGRSEAADVEDLSKSDASGARNRYRAFFGSLNGQLDGRWAFDDCRAAYILLEGLGLREEAASLGRFFVEEIAHYVTQRKSSDQPVLCIVDDAGALELGRETAGLAERLAGYGCYLYLSGQSFESLGPFAKQIVGATTTRILHRSSDPENLTLRAGTRKEVQRSQQNQGNQATGIATMQVREVPNLHPDRVKRLATGEAILVAHGHYHGVRVVQTQLPPEQLEAAQQLLHAMQPEGRGGSLPSGALSEDEDSSSTTQKEEGPVPTTNQPQTLE